MSRNKPNTYFKKSVFVSLALAIVTTFGLVSLAARQQAVFNSSGASFLGEYTNLVLNPSFEVDANNDKYPDFWKKVTGITKQDIITDKEFFEGSRSLRINSGKTKYYNQVIKGNWNRGTKFIVRNVTKGTGFTDLQHTGEFRVTFTYQDGETSEIIVSTFPGNHPWNENINEYVVDRDVPLTKITVRLGSKAFNRGEFFFDDIEIYYVNPAPTPIEVSNTPFPTRRPSSTPTSGLITRVPSPTPTRVATPTPTRIPTPSVRPPTSVPTILP